MSAQPVFRFAPSPNGLLHLGHARSALLNAEFARQTGGTFLLRIEDIDITRSRDSFVAAIEEDLRWLGLDWPEPPLRQSRRFGLYTDAARKLHGMGLLYPCRCSRTDITKAAGENPARDPDGAILYPGTCRPASPFAGQVETGFSWRLDMRAAKLLHPDGQSWTAFEPFGATRTETGDPSTWGDVILLRKEFPASYHLAVVVDDAASGVTHVVRGKDLEAATSIHRLLQELLDLPPPVYHHHALIIGADGRKLSKSESAPAIRDLRASGVPAEEVRRMALEGLE
jgi:glutamyl-Q tRNA(Asp) synthetase